MSERGSEEWPISPSSLSLLASREMGAWACPEHPALFWSLAPPCGLRKLEPSCGLYPCPAPKRRDLLQVRTTRVQPQHPNPFPGDTEAVTGSPDLGLEPDSLPPPDVGETAYLGCPMSQTPGKSQRGSHARPVGEPQGCQGCSVQLLGHLQSASSSGPATSPCRDSRRSPPEGGGKLPKRFFLMEEFIV